MGLNITIEAEGGVHLFSLDSNELAALHNATAEDATIRTAYETVFGADNSGERRKGHATAMLAAVDILARRGSHGLDTAVYSLFSSDWLGGPATSSSRIYGFKIGGAMYGLIGGVNRCWLEERRLSDDGTKVETISKRDVRGLKSIQTDNMGVIRIRKRSKPGRILKVLREIKELLVALPEEAELIITFG